MDALSRDFFLFLSKNRGLNYMARRWGKSVASGTIIGGIDFESSIPHIKRLNEKGIQVTVDHLGEFVTDIQVAKERTQECITTIQTIAAEKLDTQVSVKLTSLGLDIDINLVRDHMRDILREATKHEVLVTIDMENESRCQATLDLFTELKQEFKLVGTVIQAYLFRSENDLNDLNEHQPFIRLVKGAYKEEASVAHTEKQDISENFKKLIQKQLETGIYTAVATHDDSMIQYTKQLAEELNIPKDQFEFQMLYGMRAKTQEDLKAEGYNVRIYMPYGDDWYGYFMRRLAEKPSNISFALKGLTKK
ncbi:proline dehydrogenase family protein [Alkalicoccobacillus porphyridii]|uniref:proline dehydrogenase n=1 Tax=Alkalicoccobacillus porphyridii TaxID=2597270 RepID=A0A553ZU56_9BACI|nr:proline dehydrogenase family protein [Alkalicoccobacillus porphyridii]TSB44994.1 proline dehydrogenase [Alkalicoccobacillus porphyridii]